MYLQSNCHFFSCPSFQLDISCNPWSIKQTKYSIVEINYEDDDEESEGSEGEIDYEEEIDYGELEN